MRWSDLKYLACLIVPLSAYFGFYFGGFWSYTTVVIAFIIIPILEQLIPYSNSNNSTKIENSKNNQWLFDLLLYIIVPIQYSIIFFFLQAIASNQYTVNEIIGFTLGTGISCGVLGIHVAHELGHRATWYERWMSHALLLTSLYMHFYIEHNRGHHRYVSTPMDPATSRLNECLYAFWCRSVVMGYVSAWRIQLALLYKNKHSFFSIHNLMLLFHIIQLSFTSAIFFIWGMKAGIAFIIAAIIGFLLLECVNYIEHYGLLRKVISPGKYERVMPHHSWNSNHLLGRIILFELTRHSDHHYMASRKYQILRHFDESPQLPFGYPASIVISFFPPLWYAIMHRIMNNKAK